MIGLGIGVAWTFGKINRFVSNMILAFRARVLSFPNSVFEADTCLETTLDELNTIGLLDNASLLITPNAYNEGVIYDVVPNTSLGDLAVERATTGSRVNKTGLIQTEGINVPRLDYSQGTCPSWLIEPQRTNLATYSENFNSVGFVIDSAITTNTTNSPSGIQNADSLIENTANGNHLYYIDYNVTNGTTYTYSVFCKSIGGRNVEIISSDTASEQRAIINLSNGSILSGSTSQITVADFGNGWYRINITKQSTTSVGRLIIFVLDGTSLSYTGNGTSGLYLWGAQLEVGAYATSYIPTVATTVTRNFDKISKVGIGSLLNPSEGVFYIEVCALNQTDADSRTFGINDIIGDNYIAFQYQADGDLRFDVRSGVNINRLNLSIGSITNFNKLAVSWGPSGIYGYVNGVKYVIPQFQGTIPSIPVTLTRMSFFRGSSTNVANSYLKEAVVFQSQLTDAECISLTTL